MFFVCINIFFVYLLLKVVVFVVNLKLKKLGLYIVYYYKKKDFVIIL